MESAPQTTQIQKQPSAAEVPAPVPAPAPALTQAVPQESGRTKIWFDCRGEEIWTFRQNVMGFMVFANQINNYGNPTAEIALSVDEDKASVQNMINFASNKGFEDNDRLGDMLYAYAHQKSIQTAKYIVDEKIKPRVPSAPVTSSSPKQQLQQSLQQQLLQQQISNRQHLTQQQVSPQLLQLQQQLSRSSQASAAPVQVSSSERVIYDISGYPKYLTNLIVRVITITKPHVRFTDENNGKERLLTLYLK